jgi:hypothetical protein
MKQFEQTSKLRSYLALMHPHLRKEAQQEKYIHTTNQTETITCPNLCEILKSNPQQFHSDGDEIWR